MVGLDVTNRAVVTAEQVSELRGTGPIGRAVAELLDFYEAFYREMYDFGGCPVHDAVAVAHVIRPGLLTTVERRVDVELGAGLCRGRTVVDMRRRRRLPTPNAHVAVDIDGPAVVELLLERLSAAPAPSGQNVVRSS
jgi:inosine-uridine nucleoside N-ribohydrolase